MDLEQTVFEIVEKHLPDESHFIVEIKITQQGYKTLLSILIDADAGLHVDNCALVSRAVAEEIDAKELIEEAYVIEVSSPGVDFPLSSRRQYTKNIGRNIRAQLTSGMDVEGELLEVGQMGIKIKVKKKPKKGKKAIEETTELAFDQIKKSIVLVSFK
ncbi:ribosome maturation factor RimP [Pleomorphovibrio marinus]|uniref:ribosome maturation factor RimP n=1 Tax=Pleomorphovibrio marinus TaxID=2164132 RepID=UPI000E0BEF41|nr:ribosome maturation factor RimP [Pleomorphovibrio marinus]